MSDGVDAAAGGASRSDPFDTAAVHSRKDREIEFARLVAFSDGIFAIAITLLVLNLEIPESLPPGRSLWDEIGDQGGDLLAYAISFAVIGRLWLSHHRFFAGLSSFDGRLMVFNLTYLAFIVLIPFTSEVLGDHGDTSAGVIVYAIDLAAVTTIGAFQIRYAFDAGLVHAEYQGYRARFASALNLTVPAIFLASIPVALLNPLASTLMWMAIFFTRTEVGRRGARRVVRRH